MLKARRFLLSLALGGALFMGSGCALEDSPPDYSQRQETARREARETCANRGGIAYLNFDERELVDELRCHSKVER